MLMLQDAKAQLAKAAWVQQGQGAAAGGAKGAGDGMRGIRVEDIRMLMNL